MADLNTNKHLGLRGQLALEYRNLINELLHEEKAVTPKDFLDKFIEFKAVFSGSAQNDAHEFLGFLLDGLQEY